MAIYDSVSLLASFNANAGRPTTGDPITDADKYTRLTVAQNRVIADMAARFPESLYPHASYAAFPQCVTTDQQIFTFGTDSNGYPVFPIGKVGIYPALGCIPDNPWREGYDYLNEGTQIRIPNNRTYSGTLYWRGIINPPNIDATHQPSIFPEAARELIWMEAVRAFAGEGKRDLTLREDMSAEYARSFPRFALVWRTQFRSGGALGALTGLRLAEAGYSSTGGYGSA